MSSNTTPPSDSPITSLYLSDTFYTWHTKTNDLISKVNPIEVYSITADTEYGYDGITLDVDGYGNWTIGYQLPMVISGGHTFAGDIHFQAGISGHLVNTFNNITGDVEGVYTISGYTHGSTPDFNVEGAVFSINGVTGTTYGALTIDGSDIDNTIGAITGPAGYILTAGGTNGFTSPTVLFSGAPAAAQTAFRVDPDNNRVAFNSALFASDGGGLTGARLYVKGDNEHGIKTALAAQRGNDMWMVGDGTIAADNDFNIMCGYDGTNDYKISFSGATLGEVYQEAANQGAVVIYPSAEFDFVGGPTAGAIMEINGQVGTTRAIGMYINTDTAGGAHDIAMKARGSVYTESGFSVYGAADDTGSASGPQGIFHVVHGATYGGITQEVFVINEAGALGVSAGDFGMTHGTLMSRGDSDTAIWERRYVISTNEASGTDYTEGTVWYQV
jgi:hypothetical protein